MKTLIGVMLAANLVSLFNGNTVSYVASDDSTTVRATVTAYTSSPDETDDTPEITASGSTPAPGTIACPAKYKFGTHVEVAGAVYTCQDRMNGRYAGEERFDVWVYTKAEAMQWGKRIIDVKVLVF